MESKDKIIEEYTDIVQIELPEMRVVYYKIISESPEELALATIGSWAKRKGLWDMSDTRIFGYNCPDPKDGEKLYGYEFCITLPDDWNPAPDRVHRLHTLNFQTWNSYRRLFHPDQICTIRPVH